MVLTPRDIAAMARRSRDFDDFMLELSGVSGRTPRFLTRAQIERIREQTGSVSHETLRERAYREYLEFCDRVQRQLYAVHRAIDKALLASEGRLAEAREGLEDIRRRATVDEQGRKVYRTADQTRAFTDDGQELTREEMGHIHWDPTAPTWEQRVRAGDKLKQAQQEHDEILRYKERADYYTQRMETGDILTTDELETIHRDLNAMPGAVRAEMPGKVAQAMKTPLSAKFTLSAEDLAAIQPEISRHDPPEFSPKP